MARYTPQGRRITHRPQGYPVPLELLGAIDVQAAKVGSMRDDRDRLDARVSRLEHDAYLARAKADTTADPGLRKVLYERGDILSGQASSARTARDSAQRCLQQEEASLAGLHAQARAWQRGDHEDED